MKLASAAAVVVVMVVVAVVVVCVVAEEEVTQTQNKVEEVVLGGKETQEENEMVEVELNQGRLSGRRHVTENKRVFYSFRGIPYAKPPVGDLMFQVPIPAGVWDGMRDGGEDPQACLQPSDMADRAMGADTTTGTLDCLYLNVFTPSQPVSPPASPPGLPVMVFIHGGGFRMGKIGDYDPSPLLQRDVVVVTLQYRLGIYGFLSTEDDVLPGNLGLKDQTLALRWVQDNIHKFGGDAKRVTLFGVSAGAVAVHLHILSPHSKGLFHRAILQSGAALNPLAYAKDHKQLAFKLGDLVNCSSWNSSELIHCISQVPYPDLAKVLPNITEWYYLPSLSMPRVDGDFLPDYPAKLLKTGQFNKVDIISGFTNDEGAFAILYLLSDARKYFEELRSNLSYVGPKALYLEEEESPEYLTQRVFLQYLLHLNITENDAVPFIELFTDRICKVGHEDSALIHASHGQKVYQYNLEHLGEHSYTDTLNTTVDADYVNHADDMFYLFDGQLPHVHLTTPEDLFVRHVMIELWTNFAAYGNPTINGSLGFRWTPFPVGEDKDGLTTLSISTRPHMAPSSVRDLDFWRNLPTKTNKILFPERFLEE